MELEAAQVRTRGTGSLLDFIEVIKPRETALLIFIGFVTAIAVADTSLSAGWSILLLVALALTSGGANGLTNYLDRDIDARMERTQRRALPSGRIYPAEKALYFSAALSLAGLGLAWFLHPYAFFSGALGTAVAVIYRKRVTCVFPQGAIASCAPILMGWFAIRPTVNLELLALCSLVAVWLPSHIWSVMLAKQSDYRKAGICYFPVNRDVKQVAPILFGLCVLLYAVSIWLYFAASLGWLYLIVASVLGIVLVYPGYRLVRYAESDAAWKLYKLSAFPYLGLIFLTIALDKLIS